MINQVFSSLAVSLGNLHFGAMNSWTGASLTQIEAEFNVTQTVELSFVVSATPIGSILGFLFSGKIADIIGRRSTVLFTAPALFVAWIIIGFAPTVPYLIVGRLLCGICSAFAQTASVYINETAQHTYRGIMGSIATLTLPIGATLAYILSGFLGWRISCYIFAFISAIMFFCVLLIHESPYWYLLKNRKNSAIKSLIWFRGENCEYEQELKRMHDKIENSKSSKGLKEFFHKNNLKPLGLGMFIHVCQQTCGAAVIFMFASAIFKESSSIDERYGTVLCGVGQILGTIILIFTIDKFGRRKILTTSLCGVSISLIALSCYYFFEGQPNWFPVMYIFIMMTSYCIGCRSIPWIITPELLNTQIRSTGASLCAFFNRSLNFTIVQVYPLVRVYVGLGGVFLFFGCLSLLFCIMTPFIIPETKKKTLEEIQEYMESRSKSKNVHKKNTAEYNSLIKFKKIEKS